jgi:hypothetical protein
MNRTFKMLAALAPLAAFAPLAAQNTPIVTVLAFDNAAFGPGAKDYDGIGKGIMDLVITDLASGGKVRVVERTRVQTILDEQKLTTSGAVDGQTAVRVGRILGACYSVFGSFLRNDKTGENVLTIRTTNNETSQVQNPVKVTNKGDDILDLIAKASAEFSKNVDVKACAGNGGVRRSGDASSPAQQGSTTPAGQPASSNTVTYAKSLTPNEVKKLESSPKAKLDARTMLIYSRALDAKDRKETARAKQLAQQVKDKYPDFVPVDQLISSLNSGN